MHNDPRFTSQILMVIDIHIVMAEKSAEILTVCVQKK